MPKVKVLNPKNEGSESIFLHNGDLILYRGQSNCIMVTSYIKNESEADMRAENYCSLIKLENGQKVCSERVSRNTTMKRLIAHLNSRIGYDITRNDLEIVSSNHYGIEIMVKR